MHATTLSNIASLLIAALALPGGLAAEPLSDPDEVGWYSYRDLTSEQFSQRFEQLRDNYRVIDVEAYELDGETRYAGVWQRNTENLRWASWRNLTSDGYHEKWEQYRDEGLRPIDVEAYKIGSAWRYAGVWVENRDGLGWASFRNLTDESFREKFDEYRGRGYMPIDIEASPADDADLYSVIWVENEEGLGWKEYRNMSADTYAQRFQEFSNEGYRVLDLDSYRQNGAQRYAAIWVRNTNGRGWAAWRDMSAQSFANKWRELNDAGYRIIDFDVYPSSNGERYLGVWRQNSDRRDWGPKNDVAARVEQFNKDYDLPGISVVIAHEGDVVFRRGWGFADIARERVAWSKTLYRTASVCKAITGIISMRLLDRGVLADLDDPTRDYVPSLPAHHTHTLRQLLSHRGCVRHYIDDDPVRDSAGYDRAVDALELFQDDPLQVFDDDGEEVCDAPGEAYSYSTHAFTILAAAIERATGDTPYHWFLRSELAGPFDLGTLRMEDRSVSRYERAEIYNSSNGVLANPDDITWKLAGGGCEISTLDLVRLGMKLAAGDLMPDSRRDEMWTPPDALSSYAIGWSTGTDEGLDRYKHSGAQQGAQSVWRVYPEVGLVIGVMTNKDIDPDSGNGIDDLAADLAEIVLE